MKIIFTKAEGREILHQELNKRLGATKKEDEEMYIKFNYNDEIEVEIFKKSTQGEVEK